MRTRTRKPKLKSVRLTVEWGYESHGITISARNWSKIRRNLPVCLRGESYYYEGERFSCHWEFNGRDEPGSLVVGYGDDGAEGYVGEWKDAEIMEVHEAPPKPAEVTKPFEDIEEARRAYTDAAAFRTALVDAVHSESGLFDDLEPVDLLRACGASPGSDDEFCIYQSPTDRAAFRRGDDFGWGFQYTYRIPGRSRRSVRFKTVHGPGGALESCEGPYRVGQR